MNATTFAVKLLLVALSVYAGVRAGMEDGISGLYRFILSILFGLTAAFL